MKDDPVEILIKRVTELGRYDDKSDVRRAVENEVQKLITDLAKNAMEEIQEQLVAELDPIIRKTLDEVAQNKTILQNSIKIGVWRAISEYYDE